MINWELVKELLTLASELNYGASFEITKKMFDKHEVKNLQKYKWNDILKHMTYISSSSNYSLCYLARSPVYHNSFTIGRLTGTGAQKLLELSVTDRKLTI